MAGFRYSVRSKIYGTASAGWFFLTVMSVLFVPEAGLTKIADGLTCGSCHTMHNSQDSVSLVVTGAVEGLLNSSCVGCHTGTNSVTSMSNNDAPYVFDSPTVPSYDPTCSASCETLAGGNFYWVANVSDRKGHNVVGIAADDVLLGSTGTKTVPGSAVNLPQLTCAGVNGCHGNGAGTEFESLMPAHHVTDDSTLGTTVANSFRFLTGITGFEDTDWEFTVTPQDHNQYKARPVWDSGAIDTINSFCKQCHGDFHGNPGVDTDGTSPWLRHPTDISMPSSGEYDAYDSYSPISPVGSSNISAIWDDVQLANRRIVTCISCHRAHGSPYDAMLRWDYKAWPAGGGYNGCAVCHSVKN